LLVTIKSLPKSSSLPKLYVDKPHTKHNAPDSLPPLSQAAPLLHQIPFLDSPLSSEHIIGYKRKMLRPPAGNSRGKNHHPYRLRRLAETRASRPRISSGRHHIHPATSQTQHYVDLLGLALRLQAIATESGSMTAVTSSSRCYVSRHQELVMRCKLHGLRVSPAVSPKPSPKARQIERLGMCFVRAVFGDVAP
jgi:hypothetical protein